MKVKPNLPKSIDDLVGLGVEMVGPKRVILFGSRARGDHSSHSDWDIAFCELSNRKRWAEFLVEYENAPITLQKVDLLVYEDCNQEYRDNIDSEGVLLYES